MNRADEIAALGDADLNHQIAEGIGLHIIRCPHQCLELKCGGKYCGKCNGWIEYPAFATSYDAHLATPEHGGYVGPYAWLSDQCDEHHPPPPVTGCCIAAAAREGPRALAEACLLAIEKCKEANHADD